MVRLKEKANITANALGGFQFHYGTIKRLVGIVGGGNTFNFNSTMVRLKEYTIAL